VGKKLSKRCQFYQKVVKFLKIACKKHKFLKQVGGGGEEEEEDL
jgi:hypothetical protein